MLEEVFWFFPLPKRLVICFSENGHFESQDDILSRNGVIVSRYGEIMIRYGEIVSRNGEKDESQWRGKWRDKIVSKALWKWNEADIFGKIYALKNALYKRLYCRLHKDSGHFSRKKNASDAAWNSPCIYIRINASNIAGIEVKS